MPVRWLVLETPVPEELVVAAARLRHDATRNGRVDIFCAMGANSAMQQAIMKRLLSVVETVAFNIGLRSCIIEAAQWRVDLEQLLTECGYMELSGHIWPEAQQHLLTKPTMILEYHKVFDTSNSSSGNNNSSMGSMLMPMCSVEEEVKVPEMQSGTTESAADIVNQLSELNNLSLSTSGENTGNLIHTEMPHLFESLFAALHVEYGDAAVEGRENTAENGNSSSSGSII